MPESRLQHEAVVLLERNGLYVVNNWGTPLAHSGVPDLVCCDRGGFITFEMKYLDGKTSKAQDFHAKRIRAAGGLVYAPRSLEAVEMALYEARGSNMRPYCPVCGGGGEQ